MDTLRCTKNRKTPGIDKVSNFCLKHLSSTHIHLAAGSIYLYVKQNEHQDGIPEGQTISNSLKQTSDIHKIIDQDHNYQHLSTYVSHK